MKYLTVMATPELATPMQLYHINPANIVHLRDVGTHPVRIPHYDPCDSPICYATLLSGDLYVSGVAEELIARMT